MDEGAAGPGRVATRRATRTRRTRRWLLVGVAIVLLLSVVAGARAWRSDQGTVGDTMVTASSTAIGFAAGDVVGTADDPGPRAGWRSAGETTGAWIELSWERDHLLRQVVLVRNAVDEPGVTDGFLTFGDGSAVQVRLSASARETVVPVGARSVDRMRFTASAVSDGASDVAVDEIRVSARPGEGDVVTDDASGGNSAVAATVTGSGGFAEADTLTDGTGEPGASGVGADRALGGPGSWVQLDWERPRELSSVEIVGSAASAADLGRATLTFADGASLPVGEVLSDPEHPTVIGFMPRVTTSLRITVDGVEGNGSLLLAELRAFQRGTAPPRAEPDTQTGQSAPSRTTCSATTGTATPGLVVLCPLTGSVVDGRIDVVVSAGTGRSTVTATVWPADRDAPVPSEVTASADPTGRTTLPVDLTQVPPGPVSVELVAEGPGLDEEIVYFQLYRSGPTDGHIPSEAPATGRTLLHAEEFDGPISLARDGADADYTAAKPTYGGVEDFGDAIFPDPALGLGNVRVVDDRYLRIDAQPRPPGYDDPQDYGRDYIGGLVASARPGGSGVSAQYGYFETRMLMPAAPGTWPAFWMLPSDNLIEPTEFVAEIDAVELYGHEPTGACHVTHEYVTAGGRDGEGYCGRRFPSEREALTWHTYGVAITPTENVFYIDGQVVATSTQVQGGEAPMFFLVNLALGGGWPIELDAVQERATLYVDYIRVYV